MSLIDVIYDLATGATEPTPFQYAVTRTPAQVYSGGRKVPNGAPTTLLITALVVPTTGRDLQILEEAAITTASKKILTDTQLHGRESAFEPDTLTINGESWVVHNVRNYEVFDEVIYVVLVARASMQ